MRTETLALILGIAVAACQGANVVMFLKIRVGQLESEKKVLDEVEEKYVRKDSLHSPRLVECRVPDCAHRMHA